MDGFFNPKLKNSHVPKWNYILFRFQVFHNIVFFSSFLQVRIRALSSNLSCVLSYKAFKQMNQNEAVCSYVMIQTHSKSYVNYSVIKLSSLYHEKATCSKACLEHNCKIIVRGRVSDL